MGNFDQGSQFTRGDSSNHFLSVAVAKIKNPFKNWSSNKPGQSLKWWTSYNKTKHHRGANFPEATLDNLINAVSALMILICAQFGDLSAQSGFISQLHQSWLVERKSDSKMEKYYIPSPNKTWTKKALFR